MFLVTRITSVYDAVRVVLFPYLDSNPDLHVMLAPPQFSRQPTWYSTSVGLCVELLRSVLLGQSTFSNLHLLPAQVGAVSELMTLFSFRY